MSNRLTILAFDIGLKRTGVASGQCLTMSANPAGQLLVKQGRHDWMQVDTLIAKWAPAIILIGDPRSQDPHLNKAINRFKSHIQQNHKIQIILVDETLTTAAANQELSDSALNTERKIIMRDQIAACLILETYFSSLA